jgi:predicted O-methyltransferase YrrM
MRVPWKNRHAVSAHDAEARMRFKIGEFYSPMYDTRELEKLKDRLWPSEPREIPGIDWRDGDQLTLCADVFSTQISYPFPEESADPTEFFVKNGQYPPLDAWVLEGMLRHHRPRRMIEIGCGFSTLISARLNREEFGGQMELTCIDPYPQAFLGDGAVAGISAFRSEKVENVPLDLFDRLEDGDVLFIDTSHTVKTGGDVTWLFHEVVPRLRPGVIVHVHDIFLPHEYPEPWVLEGWGWNEMYLVRSFLLFNEVFHILWGSAYMLTHHYDSVVEAFPDLPEYRAMFGGSLWIRRTG